MCAKNLWLSKLFWLQRAFTWISQLGKTNFQLFQHNMNAQFLPPMCKHCTWWQHKIKQILYNTNNNTGSHNISIKTKTKRWITISSAIFFCDELWPRSNSDLIVLHWSIVRLYTMGSLVYRPKLDPSAVRLYLGTVVLWAKC